MTVNIFLSLDLKNERGVGETLFYRLESGDVLLGAAENRAYVLHDPAVCILDIVGIKCAQFVE